MAASFIFLMISFQHVSFEMVLLPPGMLFSFFLWFVVTIITLYEIWPWYFFILHFYIKLSFLILWDKVWLRKFKKITLILQLSPCFYCVKTVDHYFLGFLDCCSSPSHCRPYLPAFLSPMTWVWAELSKGVYFPVIPDGEENEMGEFLPCQLKTHWMYCDL